jgi:hypothetical protein
MSTEDTDIWIFLEILSHNSHNSSNIITPAIPLLTRSLRLPNQTKKRKKNDGRLKKEEKRRKTTSPVVRSTRISIVLRKKNINRQQKTVRSPRHSEPALCDYNTGLPSTIGAKKDTRTKNKDYN